MRIFHNFSPLLLLLLAGCSSPEPARVGNNLPSRSLPGTGGTASGSGGVSTHLGGASSTLGGTPPSTGGAGGTNGLGGMLTTSGGTSATASGGNTGSGGTAQPSSDLIPVFFAQGHEGRTTLSCDDGNSFILNQSHDDSFRCFIDANHDCDHSEFAARGLVFGKDALIATWGWGHPSVLKRTDNGTTWQSVGTSGPTFADIAYGADTYVGCANPVQVSKDGVTWEAGGALTFDFNYRGIEYVPTGGGMFIVAGESGESRDLSFSVDAGKTWKAPTTRPGLCGAYLRGIAGNDSTVVVASGQGHICFSKDAANTWTIVQVTDGFTSPIVWTGTAFRVYQGSKLWESSDGEAWISQSIEPNNISIGALALSPSGTYVAANDGWMVWYEHQHFFRSTDGVHFTVLDAGKFVGSHPINFIDFGYLKSGACPKP